MKSINHTALYLALTLFVYSNTSAAGGFTLYEQSASAAGTAYAGKAALGEDASAAWFNPASMSLLKREQLAVGLNVYNVDIKFKDDGRSTDNAGSANREGKPGGVLFLPNFHYVRPINERMNFGFSVAAPFGVAHDFKPSWVGRFQGLKSEITNLDFNPSLSYKVDERLSVGAGVSAQYLTVKLTQAIPIISGVTTSEGGATIKGNSVGFGYNYGALLKVSDATRVGLAYRSEVKHNLSGTADFSTLPLMNSNVTSNIDLPASLAFSSVTQLSPTWSVLTDLTWTQWTKFKELRFSPENGNGSNDIVRDLSWRDTMRYSVGAVHQYNQKTKLKFGLAYDETPVQDAKRNVRTPDSNSVTLALGSQYRIDERCTVDTALQVTKYRSAPIFDDQGGAGGTVSGQFKSIVEIVSAQLNYAF
jgi:long-chain fatty acid transport protein